MSAALLAADELVAAALAERAKLLEGLREEGLGAPLDTSWKLTPIGREVERYLKYKTYQGRAEASIINRLSPLRLLANEYAHREISSFTGREGARELTEFLIRNWGDCAASTRKNRQGCLAVFFKWAYREGLVEKDPGEFFESITGGRGRRDALERDKLKQIISAQPRLSWRLAVGLMGRCGLRRGELLRLQLGHFDFSKGTVALLGKGSKYAEQALYPDLARDCEVYCMERASLSDKWRTEYLVFPVRRVRRGQYPNYRYEERDTPLKPHTFSGLQRWWTEALERAGVEHFPMHKLRHTAGTEFHHGPGEGDYELTRQFLRHENVQTTAGYVHTAPSVVTSRVALGDGFWEE